MWQQLSSSIRSPVTMSIAVAIFITAFRQDSGIFSVSYNFGVALSDSLVIDVSSCYFSVRFISDSNF